MKKTVMIGLSGHFEYALPYMKSHGLCFDAIYVDPREEIDSGVDRLKRNGFDIRFVKCEEELYALSPDICIVNSIPGLNAGFAKRALQHGCSVFCEKPLATDTGELSELYDIYRSSKKHLSAMFGTSFTPHVAAAKKAMELIGEPMLITAQKSYKLGHREDYYFDRSLFGGIIPWVAIHSLDWAYTITGLAPTKAEGTHRILNIPGRGDIEIEAACNFTLKNGATFVSTADYLRPASAPTHDDDRMRIAGTKGILEISGGKVTVICDGGERVVEGEKPRDIFYDFMLGCEGVPCVNTGEKAFLLTRAALQARDSADERRGG